MENKEKGLLGIISDEDFRIKLNLITIDNLIDSLNEINAVFTKIEIAQHDKLMNHVGLSIKNEYEEKRRKVAIIGISSAGGLLSDISKTMHKIRNSAEIISICIDTNQPINEAVQLIDKYQGSFEIRHPDGLANFIFEAIEKMDYHEKLYDNCEHISKYPAFMQYQKSNYTRSVIRPNFIRRGRRQSYKQETSGP